MYIKGISAVPKNSTVFRRNTRKNVVPDSCARKSNCITMQKIHSNEKYHCASVINRLSSWKLWFRSETTEFFTSVDVNMRFINCLFECIWSFWTMIRKTLNQTLQPIFFFSFTSKWERPSPKRMMQCVADPSDSHTIFFSNVSGCGQKFVLRMLCKGHSCNRCSIVILHVWHGQCSDWPILNLVYIWWFNRLCPVRSLNIKTWSVLDSWW